MDDESLFKPWNPTVRGSNASDGGWWGQGHDSDDVTDHYPDGQGHDSVDDARACMDLLRLKMASGNRSL